MAAAHPPPAGLALTSTVAPFVGRQREVALLQRGLDRAKNGRGGCLIVGGPGGMGKTRLLRAVQDQAEAAGFRVHWGYCLKESKAPFFPFEQIFRRISREDRAAGGPSGRSSLQALPTVLIYEEERPRRLLDLLGLPDGKAPSLLVTRDRPAQIQERFPELASRTRTVWLSRTGDGAFPPGQMDALGSRLEGHLRDARGGILALTGVEYLVSQNSFTAVLHMVQFLRDVAESEDGHLLLSLNPRAFDQRQLSLLEGEGSVEREPATGPAGEPFPAGGPGEGLPPAMTMLRYLESMEKEARRGPLLLIVDDLHWADLDSATAFHFLARNLGDVPVLLVGATREGEAATSEELGAQAVPEMLARLEQEGRAERIRLRGLGSEEAGKLVEEVLGAPLSPSGREALVRGVLERSHGNPYHVLELVHQISDQGWVHRDAGRIVLSPPQSGVGGTDPSLSGTTSPRGPSGPLGPFGAGAALSLQEMLAQRIDQLSEEERIFLENAAVVGSEFSLEPLGGVLGRPLSELDALARQLSERSRLLLPLPSGRWAFGHPLVWEVTQHRMVPERHRANAARLADWWAEHQPGDLDAVARLYHEAEPHPLSQSWVRRALDHALEARAEEQVELYWGWLERSLGLSIENAHLRFQELRPPILRLLMQGNFRSGERLIIRFGSNPLPEDLRIEFELGRVDVEFFLSPGRALERFDALRHGLDHGIDRLPAWLQAHFVSTETVALLAHGKPEEAVRSGRRALEMLGEDGDVIHRARTHINIAEGLLGTRRWEEAQEVLAKARAFAADQRVPVFHAAALNYEGKLFQLLGDLPAARKAYEDAVEVLRSIGSIPWVATYGLSAAQVLLDLGELDAARAWVQESLSLARSFELPTPACYALLVEGEILMAEGRNGQALEKLEQARELAVKLGSEVARNMVDLQRAAALGAQGRIAPALAVLDGITTGFGEFEITLRPETFRLRGRLLQAHGDATGARRELDRAYGIARESQNALLMGRMQEDLADWEMAHGDPVRAGELRREAQATLERCGVKPRPHGTRNLSGATVGL